MIAASATLKAGIEFAAERFRKSKHTLVLTGAGFSTPSGIPDFRTEGSGLWSRFEPLETASLETFRTKPEKFYAWLRPLALQIFDAQPNPAHLALVRIEKAGKIGRVVTQNIDMLHQRAGSMNVIELHGTLSTLTCTQCFQKVGAEPYIQPFIEKGEIPRCPNCNGVLKPDVILFGEQMPQSAWHQAQRESRRCDVMVVAGSSLEVLPVAGLPLEAVDRGAHLIIINRSPTYLDGRADAVLEGEVEDIFPAIAEQVLNG